MRKIIKRDGRIVNFNDNKITIAIKKAAQDAKVALSDNELDDLTDKVVSHLEAEFDFKDKKPGVEDIQDMVEKTLTENNMYEVVRAYIIYREDRARKREMKSDLMKTYNELTFGASKDVDLKRENGNINGETAMGKMLRYGSEGAKQFSHLYLMDEDISKAHKRGDIHIHDLDFMSTGTLTCCQIDLDHLFEKGFNTGEGFIRTPNSIQSYASLACIVIQANQNDQHGGQSIPLYDYYLAPGVAKTFIKNFCDIVEIKYDLDMSEVKEKMRDFMQNNGRRIINEKGKEFTKEITSNLNIDFDKCWHKAYMKTNKDTYQSQEAVVHNLNTLHSRAGSQVPFSSINFGTDISEEGRMVSLNLLYATEAGLGNGETPIFPISILKVKEGVNYNPGDPNYDIFKESIKCSAKRLFPNFVFIDAPHNIQYYKPGHPETEAVAMGCRTRVMGNTYNPDHEVVVGRGNLSFTSINLPRLGIRAKGDINKFYKLLDEKLDLVHRQLLQRMKIQGSFRVKNFPFLMGQGLWLGSEKLNPEDTLEEVVKEGTLSIGFIGLAETLVALIGHHHGESEEAQKLGLEIIKHMRDYTDKLSEETKLNWSLLATPAEGLSGRFVKMDRKRFGVIPGVTDKDWYTNSSHVPVEFEISAADKIRIEAPYHALENAGHIAYIEMDGDPTQNLDAFEKIVRYMKECGVGYGAINHPVDRDPICGYTGIINDECPLCHRHEFEGIDKKKLDDMGVKCYDYVANENGVIGNGVGFNRLRRITGYLVGTLDRFNDAKYKETMYRKKHL